MSAPKALIGFHNFTGADWGGKFVGISKQRWCDEFMKLVDDSPVLGAFDKMGKIDLPQELQNEGLPPEVAAMQWKALFAVFTVQMVPRHYRN